MGVRTLVEPPGEFSDIRYVGGIRGQFRNILGPGDCCAVGNPMTEQRARAARNPAAGPPPTGFPGGAPVVQGVPITKPPYGMLSAIDTRREGPRRAPSRVRKLSCEIN